MYICILPFTENLKMDFCGTFSLYLDFDKFGDKAEEIVKEHIQKYMEEFPEVDPQNDCEFGFVLEWDKKVFHNIQEFTIIFCISQKNDDDCETYRSYEDIRVDLSESDVDMVKNIVLDKMYEVLFG